LYKLIDAYSSISQSKGLEQFKHPSLSQLPILLRTAVKAGWYEGSVFFLIAGKSPSYISLPIPPPLTLINIQAS
jgi:hypothetical protein